MSENQTKTDKRKKSRSKEDLLEEANRKEALTFEDLRKVLDHCETLEEETIIKLAITTGIRREDMARIELMNIHIDEKFITFWEEKKDRPWKVPLEPNVIQVLKKYIPTLEKGEKYLFPISGRTLYRRFNDILSRSGLPSMRFHDLRRSCMRLSRQMGRDIRFVMDLTGDTAETILREYEGYTIDEMNKLLEENSITYFASTMGDLKERRRKLQIELEKIEEELQKRGVSF